ncbi:YlaF family protein [Halobacillus shinanisalinarum]|uniref:YlaF family protein n=1 Tax=Halobacillus shinanisalinarum TaxID=2932258 RepID=A0ABY4GXW9_9BACI|nr:DUF5325 family protein [Halobacillus shinanisalinarum]UOQ93041.1 YlaF family protein [Halobacillus shinanisalinarum]
MNLLDNFNWNMFLLAICVILSFSFVGFALGQQTFWLAGLLLIAGFAIMGFGLAKKRKQQNA